MTALLDFARESPCWTLFYLWGIGLTAIGVAHGIGRMAVVKNVTVERDEDDE